VNGALPACAAAAAGVLLWTGFAAEPSLPRARGYRGIWYFNQPTKDEHVYKYSGGFATYPQQHAPIAVYAKQAHKTFFVYGGTTAEKPDDRQVLLHMVSYYDHRTGTVPRPVVLLNKQTEDAHDNPTLSIDEHGYLYIFSNAHGTTRPAFVHRSRRPYSVDAFDRLLETNFSYSQPWRLGSREFLFLHTRYRDGGRTLFFMRGRDGKTWSEPEPLARIEQGDYQISWAAGERIATAFDMHPLTAGEAGLNYRTNLYYLETRDAGRSWKTAAGQQVQLPLTSPENDALVRNYRAEKKLVYLKDLQFDRAGRPVLLYLTAVSYRPGPAGGPREWYVARWDGTAWRFHPITTSDHAYDHGSLYIEGTRWRVLAPFEPGPQPWATGGDLAVWESTDEGRTWKKLRQLTHRSSTNHTYVRRPVNAHPEFAAIWADGDPLRPSASALYFTDGEFRHVWRLPVQMSGETAKPERITRQP
jgi:hypothetical protein